MKSLMVVDMQKGLINANNEYVISKINDLTQKQTFSHVIYTRFYNYEESPYVQFLNWKKMMSEEEIDFAVECTKNSYIFPKVSYGLASEQLKFLKEKSIDEIVLCGTDIDACILAIAFNLFDNGIKPFFKWDCCASANKEKEIKDKLKTLLIRNFGEDCIIE